MSASHSVSSKTSASGLKLIVVPVSFVGADRLHLRGRLAARELLAPRLAVALHLGDRATRRARSRPRRRRRAGRRRPCSRPARTCRRRGAWSATTVSAGSPWSFITSDRDARAVVADGHRLVRMDGHLEQIAAAGQGLVDRVRDHLVGEVVEASEPVEPMYIPGRCRTGSRPFEDSGCPLRCRLPSAMKKSPAN